MPLWSYSEIFIIPLNVTARIENHIFGSTGDNLLILTVTCSLLKEKKILVSFHDAPVTPLKIFLWRKASFFHALSWNDCEMLLSSASLQNKQQVASEIGWRSDFYCYHWSLVHSLAHLDKVCGFTFTKPTETFQYTHYSSCHPPGVKKGFIKGEAIRLLRTNSSERNFQEAMCNFKTTWSTWLPKKPNWKNVIWGLVCRKAVDT